MRSILAALAAIGLLLAASPQAQAADKVYAAADEVEAMIAAAKSGPIAQLGPYQANLDYRTRPDTAPVSEAQARLLYFVAGRGTLVCAGPPLQLEKGAAIFVPANIACQVTKVDGGLATISIRLPRGESPDMAKGKPFASAEDFRALIAGGKNDALVTMPPPYRDTLQIRKEPQPALMHQKDDEYVYIAEGNGVFTVGGTINDAKPTTPGNYSGSGITGGTLYNVAPGAVIFVPANTPHQFSGIAGALISIDLHLPHAD